MQYLKLSIKGEATKPIKHLKSTEENYVTAWELIKTRYNNERRIVETYVQRIMEQPKINHDSADSLKQLHDTTTECLHAIENMKINIKQCDFLLNWIITQKLDSETALLYEQSLNDPRQIQKFSDLMKFIEQRFQMLESIDGERKNKTKKFVFNVNSEVSAKCLACDQQHNMRQCNEFKKFEHSKKFKLVKTIMLASTV